jgi:hypothetical protein
VVLPVALRLSARTLADYAQPEFRALVNDFLI